MDSTLRISPIDARTATDEEYMALNVLENRIRAERLPGDPPIPLEELTTRYKQPPEYLDISRWIVKGIDPSVFVAIGEVGVLKMEGNQHLVQFEIKVVPESRRQGIGRQLFSNVVDVARRENRRLLLTETNDRIPAGELFMTQMGAERGLEGHTIQLDLAELNRDLIEQWQARAPERASEFELGLLVGPFGEENSDMAMAFQELVNEEPRGNLQVEDIHLTPEQIRKMDQRMVATGVERWIIYTRHRDTARYAGYTEVLWHPNRPTILEQAGTAVHPDYRNKGLGRWMKAAMIDKVLRERPQVQYIRSGNADSNTAMLNINRALGFKPYFSRCVWQIDIDKATEYLERRSS